MSESAALNLSLDVIETKEEIEVVEPDPNDELRKRAEAHADVLAGFDPNSEDSRQDAMNAVEAMGRDLQRKAAARSQMLQTPIRDLMKTSEDGGPVAKSLVDLRLEVESLDPTSLDLDPGFATRFLGSLPGIGTPLKRYFMRYESAQTQIDSIIKSLEAGKSQLARDNTTLGADQREMRELTHSLAEQASLGIALDEAISNRLARDIPADDPRHQFLNEEVLFVLRQRIMDIQQQLAVNQQGVLATEIIIRNNKELMRGVDRALDVTVSALQVAVTVALGLAHQKVVLDKVEAVNKTTSTLIADTAAKLRTQGADIHRQASSAMLDMDSLRSAFADINGTLEEISRYRVEALPQMASVVLELDELTGESEKAIQRLEKGRSL